MLALLQGAGGAGERCTGKGQEREREKGRERERERERERKREGEKERKRKKERERERERGTDLQEADFVAWQSLHCYPSVGLSHS